MKISDEAKRYALALSFVEGIGPIRAKKLIKHFGDPALIFNNNAKDFENLSGIGESLIRELKKETYLIRADAEIERLQRESWQMHYFEDSAYPRRMRHCEDGPIILFQKGNTNLNPSRVLAIVGTRSMTDYGRHFLEQFMKDLAAYDVLVISGLAYGVDACAHRYANDNGIANAAVLAHGLDRIYPGLHRSLSQDVINGGGSMLTDFPSNTNPDRENFPKRNRLIAALSDAVLVVEAARKGGALITADLANQYNRDVFAVPGRYNDPLSAGNNLLIKSHRANLLEGIRDLAYVMRWDKPDSLSPKPQLQLFDELPANEQNLVSLLGNDRDAKSIDWLQLNCGFNRSRLLQLLMQLELKGLVESMPGSRYRIRA